ncbi:MAG: hypothetical protein L6420_09115, partial [Elusimicrobia bacterium]|nr:hypothetical protein [Elusimicrobiota bacterium]
MKLYHKLNAALFFIALISALSVSVVFFKFQKDTIIRNEAEKIILMENGIKTIISEAVLAKDTLMIADYLDNLRQSHREIISIHLNLNGEWNEIKFKHKNPKKPVEHKDTFDRIIYGTASPTPQVQEAMLTAGTASPTPQVQEAMLTAGTASPTPQAQ